MTALSRCLSPACVWRRTRASTWNQPGAEHQNLVRSALGTSARLSGDNSGGGSRSAVVGHVLVPVKGDVWTPGLPAEQDYQSAKLVIRDWSRNGSHEAAYC